ncbi:MAG: hypothetical protein H6823_05755 [Planctomycetaceae bacterium]|nr:hypothetical protein [Planctomycetaceae bacterium]
MRTISATYQDPLDLVWLHAATSLGIAVERSPDVFASWDGKGILRIGTPETLDADDSLAQMILHELCHLLVEGSEAFKLPDWGLENDPSKVVHEYATLRLQAALADTVGLREFFAATTVFRKYYDQLPPSPLEDTHDPAVALARTAWQRSRTAPFAKPLDQALRMTAEIASLLQSIAPPDSIWSNTRK